MGLTRFIDNTAFGDQNSRPGGGAIAIASGGELGLFAEEGDISSQEIVQSEEGI
ncbi:polymorphic outer membrane protein G family protein [Chlamydia abortus]|nr:polymorphic outer membrane protein G family protein [Chlamydia abortus]SGA14816.1 polymorphic outer membrane protein G family protein [Chlamydia abortus]SGA20561.1 polymorphic outer membrane protein G family protein [Chlamydia abortus]SGW23358.1 polymorphic outer membrane protein G family protein [Chlamydia abortus]SGW27430.1 polymorphic outer membrane protein G family protein [Chlamydia abortus]